MPHARVWTGSAPDEAVTTPWGFRAGAFEISATTPELTTLRVRGQGHSADGTAISVDLDLERTRPFMLQVRPS